MDLLRYQELSYQAGKDAARFPRKRPVYRQISAFSGRHFTGLVGPRGVGKTIVLKQLAADNPDAFYLSVDTLGPEDLFDLLRSLIEKHRIKLLLLDEIHYVKSYPKVLKNLYDTSNVRVIFTSSVSLSLYEATHDLSRRARLVTLFPFSFREFLAFRTGETAPPLSLEKLIEGKWGPEHLRHEFLFPAYLQGSLYPFTLEESDPMPMFRNILDRIVRRDIPAVAPHLRVEELSLIEKAVEFMAVSPVNDLNYSTVAANLGITKYKAQEYVRLLQQSFLVNPVLPSGSNVLKEPKILMHLPYRLVYRPYPEVLGALREDFFAEAMQMAGIAFTYLKSKRGEKTPDFLIQRKGKKIVCEVGGKGKGRQQFKGVKADEKVVLVQGEPSRDDQRPLFLLGFIEE